MAEVIRKLEITALEPTEFDYAYHTAMHEQYWEEKEKEMAEQLKKDAIELERAKKHAEKAEKAEKEMRIKAVRAFLAMGKDIAFIAGTLDLSIEETSRLAEQA
jgi:predicted Holliday junction resolvase-like endonuclease